MKHYIILIVLTSLIGINLHSQTDPTAQSILDSFSNRAEGAQSVTMSFELSIDDAVEETSSESDGTIIIKGDRYKLTVPDNIVWFDGEAIYTLVTEVDEVTITEPDPGDEAFLSTPSLLFTMYREGYKIRMVGESPEGSIIDLYPEELSADFSRIRMQISRSYDLISAEYKRKDGITLTIKVKEFNLKKSYKDSYFSFDEKKYNNVDIIDMRF